jgi:ABC-type lipoprotein export system ATPase subunit
MGLDLDAFASQPAAALSVGQQQRVAAARALIGAPEIMIADEPTSALDRDRQQEFLDLLFQDLGEADATLIMMSHDDSLAPRFDRVLALGEIAIAHHGGGRRARRSLPRTGSSCGGSSSSRKMVQARMRCPSSYHAAWCSTAG